MAKGTRHLTLSVQEMDLDYPYQDGDFDAVKVKKFIEVAPGAESIWRHGLERVPNHIEIVYSDRALNYPEVVLVDRETVTLKFVPEWVSAYTSQSFNIVLRIA